MKTTCDDRAREDSLNCCLGRVTSPVLVGGWQRTLSGCGGWKNGNSSVDVLRKEGTEDKEEDCPEATDSGS